jgi:hypothetical protein
LNLGHQGLDDELRQRKFYQDTEDAVESHARTLTTKVATVHEGSQRLLTTEGAEEHGERQELFTAKFATGRKEGL